MSLLLVLVVAALGSAHAARNLTFPEGFMFGAATSAYQVEGAWNTSGKGESTFDRLVHTRPTCIADNSTGDVADDSYHKYKEDVKALKDVGFSHYRFSISWPRVLPRGDVSVINQDGINYYNNLINELLANNITPVVTMNHNDLPQRIQDLGGFTSSAIIDMFEDYAHVLFTHFGDRVKWWLTFNEPNDLALSYGMEGCYTPGIDWGGVGEYIVSHNILKAHARAYHLYQRLFRSTQKGKISIVINNFFGQPRTNSSEDAAAADIFLQFYGGLYTHPIFSKKGDYPAVVKERVANLSKAEGLYRSRLPEFSEYWVNYIRGTADFYAMNFYSTMLVYKPTQVERGGIFVDMGVGVTSNPNWITSTASTVQYTPTNMRNMLKWVSEQYDNVPILITENGWPDKGGLNDTMRVRYYVNHLANILDAIYLDKVNVLGHTAWSLLDNFEWNSGYSVRYGVYDVDITDPERKRTPKESAKVYTTIIKNRKLPEAYIDKATE